MTAIFDLETEARPRDFAARYRRARPQRIGRRSRARRGRIAALMAGAIALPAFATPSDWDRFTIGNAVAERQAMLPMPYEKAGSSFPGSAFYYLAPENSEAPGFGEGIHSDADEAVPAEIAGQETRALSLRIDNSGVDRTRALQCLTAAVYYEAASEPDIGQRAVAQVVLNRVAHSAYPNTVCGVVYQGSQRRTGCQFSFTCDGSLARRPNRMFWLRAENVARAALGGYVHGPAGLATHYHTVQVNPYWAPSLHYMGTIGAHRFYRFNGRAGQAGAFRFAYAGGEPSPSLLRTSTASDIGSEAIDPVALQKAFAQGEEQARAAAAAPLLDAVTDAARPVQHAEPTYTPEQRERGGDAVYGGSNLPERSGIKEKYRNSGRWIEKPRP